MSLIRSSYLILSIISLVSVVFSFIFSFDIRLDFLSRIVFLVVFTVGIFIIHKQRRTIPEKFVFLKRFNIGGIFFIGLFIRLFWVLVSENLQISDYAYYELLAGKIKDGQLLFTSYKSTGASIFIAGLFLLFGENIIIIKIIYSIIGALQIPLLFYLVKEIYKDEQVAKISSLILCFYPAHIFYSNLTGTEIIFCFSIQLVIFLLTISNKNGHKKYIYIFLAGIVLGFSNWIRNHALLYFISCIAVLLISIFKSQGYSLSILLLFISGFFIINFPVINWNLKENKKFSVSNVHTGGLSLLFGTNLKYKGRCLGNKYDYDLYYSWFKDKNNPNYFDFNFANKTSVDTAHKRITDNFSEFIKMSVFIKMPNLIGRTAGVNASINNPKFNNFSWLFIGISDLIHKILIALSGMYLIIVYVKNLKPSIDLKIYSIAMFLFIFLHFLIESDPRYFYSFIPFISILSARYFFLIKRKEKVLPL